jgi:hypothetical protein
MQPLAGPEVAAVIFSVIPPAVTGTTGAHLVDDALHATWEDSAMHHPTDDWEPTHNPLVGC